MSVPGPFDDLAPLPVSMLAPSRAPSSERRFELGDMPRVVSGVLVPSRSVLAASIAPEYAPMSAVERVRTADRAVIAYVRGGRNTVVLHVSDDQDELVEAMETVLEQLGRGR